MAHALYPFRFRDPVTGKWVRARYRATLETIASRYATWEVTGAPSVPAPNAGGFDPFRKVVAHSDLARMTEPPLQMNPDVVPGLERALVQTFLRRYVTWCARRGCYARMNGAARLLRRVCAQDGARDG